jgi:hypothetical protein
VSAGLLDVGERVWPVLLFLVLIQVVADLGDDAGLFDVGAHLAAGVASGSRLGLSAKGFVRETWAPSSPSSSWWWRCW